MASPDLSAPIFAALTSNTAIAAALPSYAGAKTVFTASPAPADASYPMIVTPNDVTRTDQDFINNPLPVIVRDISIFGQTDTTAHARAVESLALMVRDLFHRQRQSLSVSGWTVLDIVCKGPFPGPVDDDKTIHRIVELTVRLSQ
jgi:hypothetical protein